MGRGPDGDGEMTPDEESLVADRLEAEAACMHAESRRSRTRMESLWLRFRALMREEAAVRLRERADGRRSRD